MNVMECLLGLMMSISTLAPPVAPNQKVLSQLSAAGVEFQGRDPFAGSGLCGALLPVHFPEDIHYVSLPAEPSIECFHLLSQCPNIQQVRSSCALTERQHLQVRSRVKDGTLLLFKVRWDDGYVRFAKNLIQSTQDTNGDGIVDENDVVIADEREVIEGVTHPLPNFSSFVDGESSGFWPQR